MKKMKVFSKITSVVLAVCMLTAPNAFGSVMSVPNVSEPAGFEQKVQPRQTITQPQYEAAYDAQYRVPSSAITSITNNAGNYYTSVITNAIDNNINTHWETNTPNSSTFKNAVTVTFNQNYPIARIDYQCRHDGSQPKGFPMKYRLYYSTSASGEDFRLLKEGSYGSPSSGMISIYFESTNMRRFRFEFVEAYNDWASMSEIKFYKEDNSVNLLNSVFTDRTYSALKEEYKDTGKLDAAIAQAKQYADLGKSAEILEQAKELLTNPAAFDDTVYTASQRGDIYAEKDRTHITYAQYAFDSTGYYVCPGETISVYVETPDDDVLPMLGFGQIGDTKGDPSYKGSGWLKEISLKPGINVITAPDYSSMAPAAIYIINNAYPQDQAYAPKLRIMGGTRFPLYIHGKTDPLEYRRQLEAYTKNLSTNVDQDFGTGVVPSKYFDITEVCSENVTLTTSATGALKALQNNPEGKTMFDTMECWEWLYKEYAIYSGFDFTDESSFHYRPRGKFMCRTLNCFEGAGAYCTTGYTAYHVGTDKNAALYSEIVSYQAIPSGSWIFFHEIGHSYENQEMQRAEITNNLYSLHMQDQFLTDNRMVTDNRWETQFVPYHNTKQANSDVFFHTGITYQLEMIYGDTIYGQASRLVRENKNNMFDGLTSIETLATAISLVVGTDVTGHYNYYQETVSDAARKQTGVDKLPKETRKTYYATNKCSAKDAGTFTQQNPMPVINASVSGSSVQLTLKINEPENALLCYEIYRDGTFLGVTYGSTFLDKTVGAASHSYTAIAYDREFRASSESNPVVKGINDPVIETNGDIILSLGAQNVRYTDYITAKDSNGNDITSSLKITGNTTDLQKEGVYFITVEATDSKGSRTQRTMDVTVADKADYLSDLTWKSATSGWGTVQKDKSVSGTGLALPDGNNSNFTYRKGLGAYAVSTITYDISSGGYTDFRSYVGMDKSANYASSVTFEVYLDGVKKYDSGIMKYRTQQKFVSLALNGVKELKLVITDAGDGNTFDYASWTDAMLIKASGSSVLPSVTAIAVDHTGTVPTDTQVVWNAAASGGTGTYQYQFALYFNGVLKSTSTFSSNASFSTTLDSAGTYYVIVTVKDSDGNQGNRKSEELLAAAPLSINTFTVGQDNVKAGTKVTFLAQSGGGAGKVTYTYYIYKDGKLYYQAVNTASDSFSYVPNAAGRYQAICYCIDGSGQKVSRAVAVTVS